MEVFLQIHHLDDGEEANEIIAVLKKKRMADSWMIQRPTEESNSVIVEYIGNEKIEPEYVKRNFLFDKATELLISMEREQIEKIKEYHLGVMLKIVTTEFALLIPSKLLGECGRLGVDIYVLNISEQDNKV
ncbi:MAG TPA: hypothetical protein VMT73_10200 [Anaerolineales bacterium]|nr:hypothetical protein [Anaerolineales bacterium]